VLAVGVLSPLAYGLVLFALTLAPVALVAPGRELSVVLASLAGLFILHERQARQRLTGAAIVLVGIVLIAFA
jgi:drug/metabolite transporter (DMT)-like permease